MVITHEATGVKQPHESNKRELSRLGPQGTSTVRIGTYRGVSLTQAYLVGSLLGILGSFYVGKVPHVLLQRYLRYSCF